MDEFPTLPPNMRICAVCDGRGQRPAGATLPQDPQGNPHPCICDGTGLLPIDHGHDTPLVRQHTDYGRAASAEEQYRAALPEQTTAPAAWFYTPRLRAAYQRLLTPGAFKRLRYGEPPVPVDPVPPSPPPPPHYRHQPQGPIERPVPGERFTRQYLRGEIGPHTYVLKKNSQHVVSLVKQRRASQQHYEQLQARRAQRLRQFAPAAILVVFLSVSLFVGFHALQVYAASH